MHSLNCAVALFIVQRLCTSFATILIIISLSKCSRLICWQRCHSCEGTTQGYPLAMLFYALAIVWNFLYHTSQLLIFTVSIYIMTWCHIHYFHVNHMPIISSYVQCTCSWNTASVPQHPVVMVQYCIALHY